jgi:hypothetical protein
MKFLGYFLASRYDKRPFGGDQYHDEDEQKLRRNTDAIRELLVGHPGQWFSVAEIRRACKLSPDTEVTARLRDLRKPRWGAWAIDCERQRDGVYRYRLRVRDSQLVKIEDEEVA